MKKSEEIHKDVQELMEEIEISDLNSVGFEEAYEEFYSCPKCNNEWIIHSSIYCSNCGIKLNWIKKIEEYESGNSSVTEDIINEE